MNTIDIEYLRTWIGRREISEEVISPVPLNLLSATLDRNDRPWQVGDKLPALAHWLYFLPSAAMSELGVDGHSARGGFLPPVPLPRRMWAGSRIEFNKSLWVCDGVTRTSEIGDVQLKEGKAGSLVFVKVRHTYSLDAVVGITEEQDIVYRADPKPGSLAPSPTPAPAAAQWRRAVRPDPVLLFRFSALTFNGHRIHYDRPYATETEGYPGLVVQGPLTATLLLDLLRRSAPDATVRRFEFRGVRPLFEGSPFDLCGQPSADGKSVHLWAQDSTGALCMDATAHLA